MLGAESHSSKCFFQRSADAEDVPDLHPDESMIDDLKALLDLKQDIERIKTEAKNPWLKAEAKLSKLRDLQAALERLKALKEVVEEEDEDVPSSHSSHSKRSNDGIYVDYCNLQLVETVPDVLIEKGLSRPLTSESIFHVIDCDPIFFTPLFTFTLGLVESI